MAIAIDAFNAIYQKGFILFCYLRSPYHQFANFCKETFVKIFLALELSLIPEL